MSSRFRFVKDNDCHNYMILAEQHDKFVALLACGLVQDDYTEFIENFENCRIDGISNYTFENPKNE